MMPKLMAAGFGNEVALLLKLSAQPTKTFGPSDVMLSGTVAMRIPSIIPIASRTVMLTVPESGN